MSKPAVTVNPVANNYSSTNERIIEYSDKHGNGGLISLTTTENGIRVHVYRETRVRLHTEDTPTGGN
jgi:hypothetical protein